MHWYYPSFRVKIQYILQFISNRVFLCHIKSCLLLCIEQVSGANLRVEPCQASAGLWPVHKTKSKNWKLRGAGTILLMLPECTQKCTFKTKKWLCCQWWRLAHYSQNECCLGVWTATHHYCWCNHLQQNEKTKTKEKLFGERGFFVLNWCSQAALSLRLSAVPKKLF